MKQLSFSDAEYGGKRKRTRREVFLTEMHRAVPWSRLEALIEPHYPKAGGGRRPYALATMLRIHCLQQWYGLSDPAMEEELYEIASMRQFAGLSLARGKVPDETTILNFRHLLERHGLAREIFDTVKAHHSGSGPSAATGHDRGCDDHLGAEFDQEQHRRARPRDAPAEEGQSMVLRHEGPCRGRCREQPGAQRDRHGSQHRRRDQGA